MLLRPSTCWGRCKYSGVLSRARGCHNSFRETGDGTECLRLQIKYQLWILCVTVVSHTNPSEKIGQLNAVLHQFYFLFHFFMSLKQDFLLTWSIPQSSMRTGKYFPNTGQLQSFLDRGPGENHVICMSGLRTNKVFEFTFTCMKITFGLRLSPESISLKGTTLTELLGNVNEG